jgi:ligand-binding SRPBCC domain-containing protein
MGFYQLEFKQDIQAPLDVIWDFISDPKNLQKITPEYMNFRIESKNLSTEMHPGMIIKYKVNPLPFFSTNWLTEITHVVPNKFFVDEQRMGPYKLWHHQHHIEPSEKGTLMTDIVSYIPPFGILGDLANAIFIQKQLLSIFEYRKKAMISIFES